MKSRKSIKPITYMKMRSADLLKEVKSGPVIITQNGEARAVVQDIDDYERNKNALLLLRMLAMGEADVQKGYLISQDEVFKIIEKDVLR